MSRNRLADAASPYLQQHAGNPVEWHPWDAQSLALARERGRPILLSIGYSACHWCHVMAHESFEDPATAELMNRLFVNIKVDREERPDLDKIYQLAHQMLNNRAGGWPLTVFLTPDDHMPFFSGTYFPPEPRQGMPSFAQVLGAVDEAWRERREVISQQNGQIAAALAAEEGGGGEGGEPDPAAVDRAIARLADSFDVMDGGFGQAPKFPHGETLELLLRKADRGNARQMALHTLERMAAGGVRDHLGGGFYRYSVDREWMIPHFEKMLYDNGMLLACYCDALALDPEPAFEASARGIAGWLMREMQGADGGYASSLDADSDGREGAFYVWRRDEVEGLLSDGEREAFFSAHGLDETPNFEGAWHLNRLNDDGTADEALLASAREKLFHAREQRLRPGRDDKRLTAWNALAIRGMAKAARRFEQPAYADSARRALEFLRNHAWRDGRLFAVHMAGRSDLNAYLDDYVYLVDALWEMLQREWRNEDLAWAVELIEVVLKHFGDESGGFYFTSDDHEKLIQRPRPLMDDALPSGNGIAVRVLARFGYLLGESRYLQAAEGTLRGAWPAIAENPHAYCSLLDGMLDLVAPARVAMLRVPGEQTQAASSRWSTALGNETVLFTIANELQDSLPEALAAKAPGQGAICYLCRGSHCEAPVTTPDEPALDTP